VLTLVDYSSNWRGRVPGSELVAGLRARWPELTAIELTDRSARDEIDLVRALAPRFDVVVAALFVRTASGSGRMDLAPPLVALLQDLARAGDARPLVACVFGSPYAAAAAQEASGVLVTFDLGRLAERSAADALIGDAPIHGRLPVTLPGVAGLGAGVDRPSPVATSR
jgi:beta-N-acetylhexosaminidase